VKPLGVEVRAIAALVTAPGFTDRHDNDKTLRVVKRIHHGAEVPVPVVTTHDRLAWGEVAIAAHHANQTTHTHCKIIECTDQELATLRRLDVAKRRARKGVLLLELVGSTETDVLRTWETSGTELAQHKGHARKVRQVAREWVAAVVEVNEKSIRAFDWASQRPEKSMAEPEPAWDLSCHGWAAAPGLCEDARKVRAALRRVDARLRQDQRELAPFQEVDGIPRLYEAAHKLAAYARSILPEHLCAYCKSTVAVRPACLGCKGAGWVSEEVWQRTPAELREGYLVSHGGQILDPHTMQPPFRRQHGPRPAQIVGDLYEEEESPADDDNDSW
jgi:hypothetical protein